MLREGMFLADRYEIIEQIGTGGMADGENYLYWVHDFVF